MKEISAATAVIAFENTVSTTAIFWLGGQGDWQPVDPDLLNELGYLTSGDETPHPSMAPVMAALKAAEEIGNGDKDYLEFMLEAGLRGFLVSIATPLPRDFRETEPGSDKWGWSASWSMSTSTTVYVDDLAEISPIMEAFKLEVVKRELERHKAALQDA